MHRCFGRPFVNGSPYAIRPLSVCPVCGVRALWPNGSTDQDETWHACRPRPWPHCVRWGPSSPSPKGHGPPIFGLCLLRPNGCMDQDVTWYGARPRPRRLCVRWGPRSQLPKRGAEPLHPKFLAHVYCGQTVGWMKLVPGMEVGLSPGDFVLDKDPAHSSKRGRSPLPNFWPISIVAKRLDASRCHLVWI